MKGCANGIFFKYIGERKFFTEWDSRGIIKSSEDETGGIMQTKQQLRKLILQLRNELAAEEHEKKSQKITNNLISHIRFQEADQFLLFSSFRSEVDTTEIIQQSLKTGKPVYLPKVMGKEMNFYRIASMEDLKEGYQGIREPEEKLSTQFVSQQEKKVFVLMPGAVFDKEGGRIGYGGGYYDKFLKNLEAAILPENLCKMAVAFECQMVETGIIDKEEHDIRPDYIVTEKRIWTI